MVGLIMPHDYFQGTTDKTQAAAIFFQWKIENKENVKILKYAAVCFIVKIFWRDKKNFILNKYIKSISKNKHFPR